MLRCARNDSGRWIIALFSFIAVFAFALPAFAQVNTGLEFGTATGLSTQDIRVTVAKIIRVFLGLLGIIGLGIVLTGGFLWMTSGGDEEKVAKAKRLLANGAIGLTIVLLSFSITQFVLSRLNAALNASRVSIATEEGGGGTLPPGALPGGCADPGGEAPFVCSVTPQITTVGSLVSIRGYRFGAFVAGTSEVKIGNISATIASCEGEPSWSDNTVVAVVPTLATGAQHGVLLTSGTGAGARNTYAITILDGASMPGIACIIPREGPNGLNVAIWGQGFGSDRGTSTVTFGGNAAADTFASWTDPQVQTLVPAAATSGEATVTVGAATSNGYPFTVTCATGDQCSVSNCCVEGQCVEADACVEGGPGAGVEEGPVITSVSPQTLTHPTEGTAYRRQEDVPEGVQAVVAPNGAPGNYLTLRGRGFEDTPGRVIFLGGEDAADDVVAGVPPACASAWTDSQAIVTIPAGAAIGPIRIEVGEPVRADQTDDAVGTAIEHFRPNATTRPGLCAIDPGQATLGATVAIAGVQFGAARGADDGVLFGDLSSGATSVWGAAAITTTVPNIAEGGVEVRVRASGELSNAVAFTRSPEPRVPKIREITPSRGGPGQYVTIRGEHFGSSVGKVTFTRGDEEYEVIPRFPEQCRQEWWRESEITVRIPANTGEWGPPAPPAEFNAIGEYAVRVHAREGTALRASAPSAFTVTADQPTPGICAITPSSAPAGKLVKLLGERFGSAEGVIRFFDGVRVGGDDKSGFRWDAGEVSGILVPGLAKTGPVRLWQAGQNPDAAVAENKGSNPVTFEVSDCRQGGVSACADGKICCGDGTCVAQAQNCGIGPTAGSYQWTFRTGEVPRVPRVVESCTPTDPNVIPSPSPWDQQGLGQQACVNANIAMRFTQSMALDAGTAAAGVQVYRCGGGTNAATGGTFEADTPFDGWRIVNAPVGSPLASAYLTASRVSFSPEERQAHGGSGVLRLVKTQKTAPTQPRPTDVPRDTPTDRHHFAIEAPIALVPDTAGTTYTARVFVKGANANRNPNMRAGIVIGRIGGTQPTEAGFYQQVANEMVIDGTWQELAVSVSFDSGKNSRATLDANGNPIGVPTPGFLRVYVTGPPSGQPGNDDDDYAVDFDDFEVVRQGDACATREALDGLLVRVATDNIVVIDAPFGGWSAGTWYEVIAYGTDEVVTVAGAEAQRTALRGVGTPGLRLDGDKDGQEGGNYRFRFKTRDSAEPCAVQHVVVSPRDVVVTRRGPATAGALAGKQHATDPGLVHTRADGIGDPTACFTLGTGGLEWVWSAQPPEPPPSVPVAGYASVGNGGRWCVASAECAVVTCETNAACAPYGGTCNAAAKRCVTDFCNANQCSFVPAGSTRSIFTNTATARANAETPLTPQRQPRPVKIRATVAAATPRTGTSDLTVRFEQPRVVAVYPTASCQEACPNGKIAAIVNVGLTPMTVNAPAANVFLYACSQENCRRKHPQTGTSELASVVGVTTVACPALPGAGADPCDGGIRVSDDAQIVLRGAPLEVNKSYRVVVRKQVTSEVDVPLTELNYADNDGGVLDAYSWTFRTRGEQCAPSRVELSPNPLTFAVIGERGTVTATPFSPADQCSPSGQPLDLEALAWDWNIANAGGAVARFTAVTDVGGHGAFPHPLNGDVLTRMSREAAPSCTLACMVPGSSRLPGICGNGTVEAPAEECEPNAANASWCDASTCLRKGARPEKDGGTCGNGRVDAGEECDAQRRCAEIVPIGAPARSCVRDADCDIGPPGGPRIGGKCLPPSPFSEWCDPASCLRKGAGFGSTCGNGDVGDGEDCDDGNTVSGDGCSSRCLAEGTPRQWPGGDPARPAGVLASCGDGVVADGKGGRSAGGEECDFGGQTRPKWSGQRCDYDRCVWLGTASIAADPPGTCGNGTVQAGEQCDDGAVGTCNAESGNAGVACAVHANCAAGTPKCVARRCNDASGNAGGRCAADVDCDAGTPVCEDRQPVDGDGCSASCLREGAAVTWRNAVTREPQPSQCGDGRAHTGESCDLGSTVGPPDAMQIVQAIGEGTAVEPGLQATEIRATVNGVPGIGRIELQCGYERDLQCPDSTVNGIDHAGCCRLRPTIVERTPAADATGVCRNARITVRFNEDMNGASVGTLADIANSAPTVRGAVLEHWNATEDAWEATEAKPVVTERELSFVFTRALDPDAQYRLRVFGVEADASGVEVSMRSAMGVRFGATEEWAFTTGDDVCAISRVEVTPARYLLQRRESRAPLRVEPIARTPSGDQPIVPVAGVYDWAYAWAPAAGDPEESGEDITTTDPGWADPGTRTTYPCVAADRCAFKPAEPAKNGEALASVTVRTTANALAPTCARDSDCGEGLRCHDHAGTSGKHCVGTAFTGRSRIRTFICENPWPAVRDAATWSPHEIPGERITLAYCRDQGDLKVCRGLGREEAVDARACAQDSDCAQYAGTKCLPALRDDLPAFADNIVAKEYAPVRTGTDELREEFFFLPRGASYCSVSGERCDPTLAGSCPAGEFCRGGQDAIGFRIYENERHVSAARWFRQQDFTESTTPIEVDGYRGVRSGRSVYVNAANTGSVYTNLSVLSVNDGAVPETREILTQALREFKFTTNLTDQNTRQCELGSHPCAADIDCRPPGADGTPRDLGRCNAPKDKLQRDIRRLEDLNEIRLAIEAAGTAPELSAGSFLPGLTTSRWPSWTAELGKALGTALPEDPLNVFGGACTANAAENNRFDQATCWSQERQVFAAPTQSYLYLYRRYPTGAWELRGGFEYIRPDALEPADLEPSIAGLQRFPAGMSFLRGGILAGMYGAAGRCGDGVLASGEECDPPGSTEAPTSCRTSTGVMGSQFLTCQGNCTWSATPSACGALCGNFVIDGSEQCDVGSRGGRVRPGHPTAGTIPGITSDTQYACSAMCVWTGGRCGDDAVQAGYGEQCDGRANVATSPSGSSATTQYGCTAPAHANPCRVTGGFCGDGIIDRVRGEQCDGDEAQSCSGGTQVRSCGKPGTSAACTWLGNWSECRPAEALCGNGTVEEAAGEQCDDGGKGRCTNDPRKVCVADAECGAGSACDRSADACTSDCKANVCGDAAQLAPTCTAGDPGNIGKPCASNADCGRNGLCATEQCDLGTSNWRSGAQCVRDDRQCVDRAECPYGRTCNYCLVGSCSIATKQGGFCGDRVKNGPEVCDFTAGTDQPAANQNATNVNGLSWRREVCTASCNAKCPPQYANQTALFVEGASTAPSAQFRSEETKMLRVPSCRLFGDALRVDADIGSGVDIWPSPISVVIVTDRSGSMVGRNGTDVECDANLPGNETRMYCATRAVARDGGLLDKLATSRESGEVRVALVSFGDRATYDSLPGGAIPYGGAWRDAARMPLTQRGYADFDYAAAIEGIVGHAPLDTPAGLRDITDAAQRTMVKQLLRNRAQDASYNGTSTFLGIRQARAILDADATARTKVIILLSDGAVSAGNVRVDVGFDGVLTVRGLYDRLLDLTNLAATDREASAFKDGGGRIFTIAFPQTIAGMTNWSSGTGFSFAGSQLDTFYQQIVGAIAGVQVTVSVRGVSSAPAYFSRTASGVRIPIGAIREGCSAGAQPTNLEMQLRFRTRVGGNPVVTLSNPIAQICPGPPWKP